MSERLLSGDKDGQYSPTSPVLLQLQRSVSFLDNGSSREPSLARTVSTAEVAVALHKQSTASYISEENNDKLSGRAVFCNFALSIIGTTVLGIASQMKRAGWILAPALLVVGCIVVVEMTYLVSVTIDKMLSESLIKEVKAYTDYAGGAFGVWGLRITALTSGLGCVGMICSGMIVEAQNLNGLVPLDDLGICETYTIPNCGKSMWSVLLTFTTVFYCFVPTSTLLKATAKVGPICCILCVLFALLGTGNALQEQEEIPASCRDQAMPYWYVWPPSIMPVAAVSAYMFYCFACVTNVPTLKDQMTEPRKLVPAASGAYISCSMIFLVIMAVGYAGFGNLIPDNLIQGMRVDRPDGWWATERGWESGSGSLSGNVFSWMITINLLMTDAVFVPCTIVNLERLNPDFFDHSKSNHSRANKIALRIFISILRLVVTTSVKSFVSMTTLTSSLFCVMDNILLPILAFYSLRVQSVSLLRKFAHVLIFCFGVAVAVVGTSSAISEMVSSSSSKESDPGTYPAAGISAACARAYNDANSHA